MCICALVVHKGCSGKAFGTNRDKRDINFRWHCRAEQDTKFRHPQAHLSMSSTTYSNHAILSRQFREPNNVKDNVVAKKNTPFAFLVSCIMLRD